MQMIDTLTFNCNKEITMSCNVMIDMDEFPNIIYCTTNLNVL